ncbi:hypothetical protein SO802_022439 [Lithocarpus litseifolius]|uniref:Uncharacterized protein n=1 Tax=Lithocarpus litseifolius TaxID=425828 RepID=A0AAW2CJ49_9ROSI
MAVFTVSARTGFKYQSYQVIYWISARNENQLLQSSNSTTQVVDSEDEKEEVVVIRTNQLQSSDFATQFINFEDEVVVTETNQLWSSNFAGQAIDFEDKEEEEVIVTRTNFNFELLQA